jgi:hypothetical protein
LIQICGRQKTGRQLVWYFDGFNDLAAASTDFHLEDLNADGTEEIMCRGCRSRFCPGESLAVIIDVAKRQLLRLDWNIEKGGLKLFDDAMALQNHSMRIWLLDWWSEWPGSKEEVEKSGLRKQK